MGKGRDRSHGRDISAGRGYRKLMKKPSVLLCPVCGCILNSNKSWAAQFYNSCFNHAGWGWVTTVTTNNHGDCAVRAAITNTKTI